MRTNPWHQRERVDGDSIGPHGEHSVDRRPERRACLPWEAVDQVDVDRRKSQPACMIEQRVRQLHRLHAVDGQLHGRVEVLHAHRQTVEAELPQHVEVLEGRDARVHLDGHLAVRVYVEVGGDGPLKIDDLRGRQIGRGAAAPVVLHDSPTTCERFAEHGELALQVVEVGRCHVTFLRDDDHAATKRAALLTEGQVKVQRQGGISGHRGLGEARTVRRDVEARVELHGGGVRGVARSWSVVLAKQVDGDGKVVAHATLLDDSSRTASTSTRAWSGGVCGRMPWPRLKICPTGPA